MPITNYVNCTCCGNQFTDDHEEDARFFVCWQCDEARCKAEWDDADDAGTT